ncbi:RNA polymerase sigma factor [Thermoflexibacter ruber]|uniref:RNA polymerase sigma-70 factor, ECF subfamily n=1 Tax=Thermoflexibacter ruber TaxID=1003 RepID=A0A1I2GBR5_9BACT|nr:RNA polymerase sigma factor [Thermoflexibacter ruber]SFF14628.1 RNA polymerase sigma-70 factor, ECF subfamily [Thermoflexibacter ruber]
MQQSDLSQQFLQIIETHKGILYKVAKTYCQNDVDRQDLLQEIMLQIWKSLPNYNTQFAITTWLYRIALNVAISFYRKSNKEHNKNTFLLNENHAAIPDMYDINQEERLQILDKFIAELNNLDKALILLYLEDKSHAEIASIMGISVSNVGTKIGRIKEKLKNRFT